MRFRARLASWYIPNRERARGALEMFLRFALQHHADLVAELGPDRAHDLYTRAARSLGRELAEQLRDRLRLSDGPEAAVLAWRIAARMLGFRVRRRATAQAVEFEHLRDPLWEAFCTHGTLLCQQTCIPLTESLAQAFWAPARVELVREPTLERPCIKRLRFHPENS